ncbi:uncharacterized protein LOC113227140 [Hyposmocoma kahamanoa]|uniref:uncharacterized protein LOC113227140 n=1 Tax=Hyposmocoma kahamanoa TaxID=1477025 RepID=UPI000E6D91DA|nr:uncharacterized protein LOC113227140 [Hyposmocoma kahamanoa]
MSPDVIYFILLLSPVLSRTLPRFEELDEDEQHLFRAAYDAPSYNQQEYGEEDLSIGKLDLVKDGLWMLKAKVKELKAFDKALAANMLATKLKLKELLKKQLVVAKKPHYEKPSYNYQAPSYQAPAYPQQQYEPQYPAPQYAVPQTPQYAVPQAPQPQYAHDPYYGH